MRKYRVEHLNCWRVPPTIVVAHSDADAIAKATTPNCPKGRHITKVTVVR